MRLVFVLVYLLGNLLKYSQGQACYGIEEFDSCQDGVNRDTLSIEGWSYVRDNDLKTWVLAPPKDNDYTEALCSRYRGILSCAQATSDECHQAMLTDYKSMYFRKADGSNKQIFKCIEP